MITRRRLCWLFFLGLLGSTAGWGEGIPDLASLSLEQLMEMQVTSVSKTPEKSFGAPAAVYVISSEDIRRSGFTSIHVTRSPSIPTVSERAGSAP